MKEILQQTFDKIYCINLDTRPERWDYCKKEFAKYNMVELVERYPAVSFKKDKLAIKGITTSHINVIKLAKQNNYKNVLIFEDDVQFITYKYIKETTGPYEPREHYHRNDDNRGLLRVPSDPSDILNKALVQLKKHEWDILFLGAQLNLPRRFINYKRIDNNLFKCNSQTRCHAYAVNNSAYDFILKNDSTLDFIIFDRLVRDFLSYKLTCLNVFPIVCTQNQSFPSDRRRTKRDTGLICHERWTDKMLKNYHED